MIEPNIQPANTFAQQFGVKALIYGPPGGGKTPLISSAPAPLLMVIEPGMLSMRSSVIPAFALQNDMRDPVAAGDELDGYYDWYCKSQNAQQYHTWAFDSISQIAEVYLARAHIKLKDGRAAYGKMADDVLKWINLLYYTRQKHVVLLAKQGIENNKARPYFPGKELNTVIPHLFDEVLQLALHVVPGRGEVKALRTSDAFDASARDRSGRLDAFEYPDLSQVFTKIMRG